MLVMLALSGRLRVGHKHVVLQTSKTSSSIETEQIKHPLNNLRSKKCFTAKVRWRTVPRMQTLAQLNGSDSSGGLIGLFGSPGDAMSTVNAVCQQP